jgi:hypothetical protein
MSGSNNNNWTINNNWRISNWQINNHWLSTTGAHQQ